MRIKSYQKVIFIKPIVSIIMPTYNSAKYLERCLNSIQKQTFTDFEIIIVDRGSTDRTQEIIKSINDKRFKFFFAGSERTSQFNYGVKQANGEYIYYCGSDFVLDETLIEKTVMAMKENNGDAAIIINESDPTISFWSKVRSFERNMYKGDDLMEAARFFRKDIYENVGGYDDSLVAYEEHDLQYRLIKDGYRIIRVDDVKELHIGEPKTLGEIAKKHYYYGKTIGEFINKNPKKARKQITPLRASYLRHWDDFLKHPILSAGFILYQFVRYSSAGLGFSITKLRESK